ncbi:hypothetical protein ACVWZK_000167 [Bradyrhizobium sp. GM0.4]
MGDRSCKMPKPLDTITRVSVPGSCDGLAMGQKEQQLEADRAWQEAEAALAEARNFPAGSERHEALKRAGRLRLEAERLRQAASAEPPEFDRS